MRIISGQFGGRVLKVPPSNARFRPTTGRVRESLFNILTHSVGFEGRSVLDLFAGTGSLGIEGLSRGAERAVFVESNRKHVTIIRDNIAMLGLQRATTLVSGTVESYLKSAAEKYDLIFCDPPYDYSSTSVVLETIAQKRLLNEHGLMCIEHSGKSMVDLPTGLEIVQLKSYGTTSITIVQQASK